MTLPRLHSSFFALLMGGALSMAAVSAGPASENQHVSSDKYTLVDSGSLLGSYLAGRIAQAVRDNEIAANYYSEALEKDPESTQILEEAFQLKVLTGNFGEALKLAKQVATNNSDNKIASLFLGIDAFKNG